MMTKTLINELQDYISLSDVGCMSPEYADILQQEATTVDICLQQAIIYEKCGNIEKAKELYEKVKGSKNSRATMLLGNKLAKKRRIDDAFKCYDLAVEIDPKEIKTALINKGFISEDNYKIDDAMIFWEKVLEIDPQEFLALYGKAEILRKRGKLIEAIKIYDEILEMKYYEDEPLTLKSRKKAIEELEERKY